jgi:hypothetical protein
MIELSTSHGVAYKFKDASGKWTPYLHYLSERGGHYVFAPVEPQEGVLSIFMAASQDLNAIDTKVFTMCKFYGTWEPATHECGKDCPLGGN